MRIRERIFNPKTPWRCEGVISSTVYKVDKIVRDDWGRDAIKASFISGGGLLKDLSGSYTFMEWLGMMRINFSASDIKEFYLKTLLIKLTKLNSLDELKSILVELEI